MKLLPTALLLTALAVLPAVSAEARLIAPAKDGPVQTVALPDGSKVDIQPVRRGQACGVQVNNRTMMTQGAGETAENHCVKLVAIGALPAMGPMQRIGLLYDITAAHAPVRAAVILQSDGDNWAVDYDTIGTYDDTPAAESIAALSKAVQP